MSLICIRDYEKRAAEILPKGDLDYYRSGDSLMTTIHLNRDCYQRLRLRPKCLRNVSEMDLTMRILGCSTSMPVGISPTAFQIIAHPDGELATARAAEKAGVIYIQSCASSYTIEEVAEVAPKANKWFQLYIFEDRIVSEHLVRRAEKSGFKAIVLTVDSPQYGISYASKRNNWDLPAGVIEANIYGPGGTIPRKNDLSGYDKALTWDEGVKWLVNLTNLPVIAKGVLRAEDAVKAIEVGCKAVIVSNHGGRNVDTAPATIEVLPGIVQAVDGRVPVLVDGGITMGIDVIKALALGAQMVLLGRPILWGLTVNGQNGVDHILELIKDELETTMKFCGTPTLKDITRDMVVHPAYYMEELLGYQRIAVAVTSESNNRIDKLIRVFEKFLKRG